MTDTTMEIPTDADALIARAVKLRSELGKVLIGQEAVVDQLLCAMLAGGHVLIEGVPGLGKTLMVRALAAALDCQFARIQFTPDLMPSDVMGHAVYDPKSESFTVRRGPVFTNLLLADEINRAPAKTQSALLEAMQEGQVTVEGRSQNLPSPFMTIATQNPVEHEGTYPLPEAQLDRFLFKIQIAYPSAEEEARMVAAVTTGNSANDFDLGSISTVMEPAEMVTLQRQVSALPVDPAVVDYAVRICHATRDWPGITLGSGPRGSIALIRAARAHAALDERDFVMPDDVREIALPALRHRVVLAPELQIEGQRVDTVLETLLDKVEAPRR